MRVEDAALGYGLTAGQYIWVSMPFIDDVKKENALNWWGDVEATTNYINSIEHYQQNNFTYLKTNMGNIFPQGLPNRIAPHSHTDK